MIITQEDNGKKGQFVAKDEQGVMAGHMTYTWAGETMFIIDHTIVEIPFEGKGVGKELVMAGVEFAREKNVKIMPLCPFAKAMFDRKPEIRDVLS